MTSAAVKKQLRRGTCALPKLQALRDINTVEAQEIRTKCAHNVDVLAPAAQRELLRQDPLSVAEHTQSPRLRKVLTTHPNPKVRAEVARRTNSPAAQHVLALDPEALVRDALAANAHLSPKLVAQLSIDADTHVRQEIANRLSTARRERKGKLLSRGEEHILGHLAGDPERVVRLAIAKNIYMPQYLSDPDPGVRKLTKAHEHPYGL